MSHTVCRSKLILLLLLLTKPCKHQETQLKHQLDTRTSSPTDGTLKLGVNPLISFFSPSCLRVLNEEGLSFLRLTTEDLIRSTVLFFFSLLYPYAPDKFFLLLTQVTESLRHNDVSENSLTL